MIGEVLIVVGAYFLGSLPTALLVVKWVTGRDIRLSGSGNVGGTNAARAAGLRIGAVVTLVDMAKGALPVMVMQWYDPASRWLALAMLAAVVGHIFPVWLRFRGGKGVATAFGAFLVLAPAAAGVAFLVWLVVVVVGRFVALGSMIATACFPVLLFLMEHPPEAVMWAVVAVSVLIVIKHRPNMENLVRGIEPRIGFEDWDHKGKS
ncbi:MAG: acyl-phosphate glycerol 3-phosphate acyltransferase [Acidobacteria bacterium]|nr:MAG: acyl-phosphate glycerol 3-phosphate acyltransferase [Acidobacteriota bacterium]RLE34283.1 MAG: acyl-phosphate glycerol 3-phosphate acyltransferase [Acidobacteriota bacterium]